MKMLCVFCVYIFADSLHSFTFLLLLLLLIFWNDFCSRFVFVFVFHESVPKFSPRVLLVFFFFAFSFKTRTKRKKKKHFRRGNVFSNFLQLLAAWWAPTISGLREKKRNPEKKIERNHFASKFRQRKTNNGRRVFFFFLILFLRSRFRSLGARARAHWWEGASLIFDPFLRASHERQTLGAFPNLFFSLFWFVFRYLRLPLVHDTMPAAAAAATAAAAMMTMIITLVTIAVVFFFGACHFLFVCVHPLPSVSFSLSLCVCVCVCVFDRLVARYHASVCVCVRPCVCRCVRPTEGNRK